MTSRSARMHASVASGDPPAQAPVEGGKHNGRGATATTEWAEQVTDDQYQD
ncbi:MAG TPA: hypothetical protein VGG54_21025 [Trebonia sp.]|jgi:hypothetical protein